MALTVPDIQNIANASTGFDFQAVWDQQDFAALAIGSITGVYSGCQVVPNATPNYGASVDPGYLTVIGNAPITVAGGSVAVAAADATDRRDIIVANSAGGIGIVKGTDCGTAGWTRATTAALPPIKPSFGASVMLGEIAVPGGAASVASIAASCIVDKRVMLVPSPLAEVFYSHGSNYSIFATTMAAIDSSNLVLNFVAPPSGNVRITCNLTVGASVAATSIGFAWMESGSLVGKTVIMEIDVAAAKPTFHLVWLFTGLTPGAAHTYDLACGTQSASDPVVIYATGGTTLTMAATPGSNVHLIAEAA